jgi:hypothetical protein
MPPPKFPVGAIVIKAGGDYRFRGDIRSVFAKRSGAIRYVVENDDGTLHIFNEGQLTMEIDRTPQSLEQYNIRFHRNARYSGHGLETHIHMPCPFCAAPDWLAYPVIASQAALEKGATCAACGRSAKGLFKREPGHVEYEIVQTGGDDMPEWLRSAIRRIAS